MTEENQNNDNKIDKEEQKNEGKDEEKSIKSKFTFKCTRCDECCLSRGPIPITLWDIELWAKNGVIANFLPYLDLYNKPNGGFDLILKPMFSNQSDKSQENPSKDPFAETPIEQLLEEKCPMYNKEKNQCLIYENRPLSCRTYPLEFDGTNFIIVDENCKGIGEEGMSKEDLKDMREIAKTMFYELSRIRIALPILNQILSNNFMKVLIKQQMEAMSNMSDEDKVKLDEILQKGHQHSHEHENAND
jgi:Fe-S-cluster containining protein